MRQLILLATFVVSAFAVDFARVCQATSNIFAPSLVDCQGYKDAIKKRFSGGYVYQTDFYSSCETVYEQSSCKIALCAFPRQGINSTNLITVVDDILNNCQKVSSFAPQTKTGGYNIVKGTNITLGVFGSALENQYATYKVSTVSASAVFQDCIDLSSSISVTKNYTQNDKSGCTVVGTSGTCSLSYCDTPGLQMPGDELRSYAQILLLQLNANNKIGGFKDLRGNMSAPFVKRIGYFNAAKPAAVLSDSVFCYNSTNIPTVNDCAVAGNKVGLVNGAFVTQDQNNTDCKRISVQGTCQLNLCAPYGTQVKSSMIVSAIRSVNSNCGGGSDSSNTGGYIRIAGTDATLSLGGLPGKMNVWVNAAPNNSPKRSDVTALMNNLNAKTIYRTGGNKSPQSCTLLATNGTAKVNLCGPDGTVISGGDLREVIGNILFENALNGNNQYSSGVAQVSFRTNVTVYDPPISSDFVGELGCDGSKFDNYPNPDDCLAAVRALNAQLDAGSFNTVTAPGGSQCVGVSSSGSCQIAACAGNGAYPCPGDEDFGFCTIPAANLPARLIASAAAQLSGYCTYTSSSDKKRHTQGVLGIRSGYAGNWQVKVVAAGTFKRSATTGTHDLPNKRSLTYRNQERSFFTSRVAKRAIMTSANPNFEVQAKLDRRAIPNNQDWQNLAGTPFQFQAFLAEDGASQLSTSQVAILATGLVNLIRSTEPGRTVVEFHLDQVPGYDEYTGARFSLTVTAPGTDIHQLAQTYPGLTGDGLWSTIYNALYALNAGQPGNAGNSQALALGGGPLRMAPGPNNNPPAVDLDAFFDFDFYYQEFPQRPVDSGGSSGPFT